MHTVYKKEQEKYNSIPQKNDTCFCEDTQQLYIYTDFNGSLCWIVQRPMFDEIHAFVPVDLRTPRFKWDVTIK